MYPKNSHSDFYNYKSYFSIVLFVLVDSNYCFIYIDVGANGRTNDSSIIKNLTLRESLENGSLNFPPWGVILGDDGFPLKNYLMKPFTRHNALTRNEKIFNYRLSRARRVVENAFGILAMRFRIFRRPIMLAPEKIDDIVKAACALHIWLRTISPSVYLPQNSVELENENGRIVPASWRIEPPGSGMQHISIQGSNNSSHTAQIRRQKYCEYFIGQGALPWQDNMIK